MLGEVMVLLDVCLSVHRYICVQKKNQLDATVVSSWFFFCTNNGSTVCIKYMTACSLDYLYHAFV